MVVVVVVVVVLTLDVPSAIAAFLTPFKPLPGPGRVMVSLSLLPLLMDLQESGACGQPR